jgi:hypothetical protein
MKEVNGLTDELFEELGFLILALVCFSKQEQEILQIFFS